MGLNVVPSCRVVIKSPADLTSHAHFARLFQKQLVEVCVCVCVCVCVRMYRYLIHTCLAADDVLLCQSCRCPVHAEGEVGTLARQLGKTDPQRLLK